ncbi:hypothetical protein, partial [Aureimonas sp. AU4]|uniref:hypothetical protein n=1 Tax=Aureimonas sp. AU4 TaxID=1638163 RepID=UPI001AEBF0B1
MRRVPLRGVGRWETAVGRGLARPFSCTRRLASGLSRTTRLARRAFARRGIAVLGRGGTFRGCWTLRGCRTLGGGWTFSGTAGGRRLGLCGRATACWRFLAGARCGLFRSRCAFAARRTLAGGRRLVLRGFGSWRGTAGRRLATGGGFLLGGGGGPPARLGLLGGPAFVRLLRRGATLARCRT